MGGWVKRPWYGENNGETTGLRTSCGGWVGGWEEGGWVGVWETYQKALD